MNKLKATREAAGLSQSQLANAAGIPVRTYQGYESASPVKDISRAEARTVVKIARALGTTVEELLEVE